MDKLDEHLAHNSVPLWSLEGHRYGQKHAGVYSRCFQWLRSEQLLALPLNCMLGMLGTYV